MPSGFVVAVVVLVEVAIEVEVEVDEPPLVVVVVVGEPGTVEDPGGVVVVLLVGSATAGKTVRHRASVTITAMTPSARPPRVN